MVSEGLSQQTIPERSRLGEIRRWARKTVCMLGCLACTAMSAGVAVEMGQGERLQPSVVRLDTKEVCQESVFIAVFLSGVGFQTAFHAGRNNHQQVRAANGCTIAVEDFGTRLDIDRISQELVASVEETLGESQDAQILFVGNSNGGIVAQKIADSEAFRSSPQMHAAGYLLQATPGDLSCVRGALEQAVVGTNKPHVSWGKTPLLVMNIGGIFKRYDFTGQALADAGYNTSITDSRLMSKELEGVKQGFPEPLPPKEGDDVPEYWHQSIAIDHIQDPECSRRYIDAKIQKIGAQLVRLDLKPIDSLGNQQHASDWWGPDYYRYLVSNSGVFQLMRKKFEPSQMGAATTWRQRAV